MDVVGGVGVGVEGGCCDWCWWKDAGRPTEEVPGLQSNRRWYNRRGGGEVWLNCWGFCSTFQGQANVDLVCQWDG